ncbi:hypothetical protein TYRP_000251 [Tyrophagus putrescentiae]|nr:hypothetical protein TYRP_000251 [Tyrophagus putrescentiae]
MQDCNDPNCNCNWYVLTALTMNIPSGVVPQDEIMKAATFHQLQPPTVKRSLASSTSKHVHHNVDQL